MKGSEDEPDHMQPEEEEIGTYLDGKYEGDAYDTTAMPESELHEKLSNAPLG